MTIRKNLFIGIILLLTLAFSEVYNGFRYFIIDSCLYRIEGNRRELLAENIIDFFYYQNLPFFIQKENYELNILTIKKVRLIPFFNRETLQKVMKIKTNNNYIGNFQINDQVSLVTDKTIYTIKKDFSLSSKNLVEFECIGIFNDTLVLKNFKNNLYYIYNVNNLSSYVFSTDFDVLLQVYNINGEYLVLGLKSVNQNEYTLILKYETRENSKILLSRSTKVSYDFVFYFIPINEDYIVLQDREKAVLYKLIDKSFLRKIATISSYYSYFANDYLFVMNESNLNVFYFENGDFVPLFSIPRVNFMFFMDNKLYYVFYDVGEEIWKFTYVKLEKHFIAKDNNEIIFFTLPEEVIPII